MNKNEKKPKKGQHLSTKSKKKNSLMTVLLVVAAVIALVAATGLIVFSHFYQKLNYDKGMSDAQLQDAIANYNPDDYRDNDNVVADTEKDQSENGGNEDIKSPDEELAAQIDEELSKELEELGDEVMSNKDVWNIMLIGSDGRTLESRSRSDAMILVSINKNTKQITLTSFMRDSYVSIPGCESNRLNVPYAIAGSTLLMETMEKNFGIHIDNYVAVNFFAFIDVLDAMGGVDMEITKDEIYEINISVEEQNSLRGLPKKQDKLSNDQYGMVHLNGNQALAYARIRHIGGDQGRTERQRKVILALIDKARSMSLTQLTDTANVLLPLVATDLKQSECMSLLLKAADYKSYEINTLRIPQDGEYYGVMINGMAVLKIDFKAARKALQEQIYGIYE